MTEVCGNVDHHRRSSAGQCVEEEIMGVAVDCVMRGLLFQALLPCSGLNRSVDAFGRLRRHPFEGKDVSHFGDGSPARRRWMGVFQKESVSSSLAISASSFSHANLRGPWPLAPVSARGLAT